MRVTGTVADVRPYLAEAAVLVVPLRIGGGTRLKIFEGLAMGKAVVSTTVGAEGLPLIPGEHFRAADDPRAFAREVVSCFAIPAVGASSAWRAAEFVADHYSWPQVTRAFEENCLEVLAAKPPFGPGRSR